MQLAPLLIRADENSEIGSGHVMRCLALAQAWQAAGGKSVFVASSPSPSLMKRIASESCEFISCSVAPGSGFDAENVTRVARDRNCEWLAFDGYGFQSEFQSVVRQSGRKVLLIDDYGRLDSHCADLVLDQNFGARESLYGKRLGMTRLLLGCAYILLRNEFTYSGFRREARVSAKRILITMGGSDPDHLTEFAIRALADVNRSNKLDVAVILGSHNEHQTSVERALHECLPSADLINARDRMSDLIANCDLAIVAAGGTLWEMMRMGCPVVSFARNEIQDHILRSLHGQGIVHYLSKEIMKEMQSVTGEIAMIIGSRSKRERMSVGGKDLVDGKGAQRVCEAMSQLN